ncbi:MAG: SAM-dependent methyltransferase [Planctomycetaceae bacterium]|nr:SAM-dependent methyltransferase [Planctomycetaceae bacterium]
MPFDVADTRSELDSRLAEYWPGLIQFVLSQPHAGATSEISKISARTIHLKEGERVQLTHFRGAQQTHSNLLPVAARTTCCELLDSQFEKLHVFTSTADIVVKRKRDGSFAWRTRPATKVLDEQPHNRRKQYLIPEDIPCPFLMEIGVMNREGRVLAAKYHKFRQINRFLELVDDILPHLPQDREIQVVDFGSGKSYLTFALHHLLTQIRGRAVKIVGVDRKSDVIRDCSRIANELQCCGLSFEHGDIAQFGSLGQVDLMVSLHACDTATDAALAQAVRWETPVILAVPCCQHELAAQLNPDPALAAIAAHGILKERFAALATDALRANLLELCGYQTQVVEFIDLEHTPKNLLIRAIRRNPPATRAEHFLDSYQQLVKLLGIETPYLEASLKDLLPPVIST